MLVKTSLGEILKNVIEGNVKITDNSVCGVCSKCGEFCTNILPVSQKEIDKIQEYVNDFINEYFDGDYSYGYRYNYLDCCDEIVYDKDGNEKVAFSVYIPG